MFRHDDVERRVTPFESWRFLVAMRHPHHLSHQIVFAIHGTIQNNNNNENTQVDDVTSHRQVATRAGKKRAPLLVSFFDSQKLLLC